MKESLGGLKYFYCFLAKKKKILLSSCFNNRAPNACIRISHFCSQLQQEVKLTGSYYLKKKAFYFKPVTQIFKGAKMQLLVLPRSGSSYLKVVIWQGHANKDEYAKKLKAVAARSKINPSPVCSSHPRDLAHWNGHTFLCLNNGLSSPSSFCPSFFFKKSACWNKEIF